MAGIAARRVCYLHVGTHKTGTTSIQAFLGVNGGRLAAHGVFVPLSGRTDPAYGSHHNIAWELRGDGRYRPEPGGVAELAHELRATDAHTACLSSEDFELLWYLPHRFASLCDVIRSAGWEPRAIVYLRAQSKYCERIYAELLKHGFRTPFRQYLEDVLRIGTFVWDGLGPPFDYQVLLEFLQRAVGADAVVVRAYRERLADRALLAEFTRILGVRDVSAWVFPQRLNQTGSFAGILRTLGATCAVDDTLPFELLTPVQLARVALRFGASNLAVGRRYHVAVPPVSARELMRPVDRMRAPKHARAAAAALIALANLLS